MSEESVTLKLREDLNNIDNCLFKLDLLAAIARLATAKRRIAGAKDKRSKGCSNMATVKREVRLYDSVIRYMAMRIETDSDSVLNAVDEALNSYGPRRARDAAGLAAIKAARLKKNSPGYETPAVIKEYHELLDLMVKHKQAL